MTKYVKGLVSVIIPTYKRSDKLERAIYSILNQTYNNIEVLLVNDNISDDDYTKNIVERSRKFERDSRFRLILQEQHINGAVARNVGIKAARGEYIAFLDDDDWWEPNKIEKQVEKLSLLDEEWGGVSCRIKQYDNDKLIAKLPKYRSGYVYKDILMLRNDFATGTLLLKHEALDRTGYFDENLLRHQDLQLLVNFTYKYKLYQLNEFLHCCDISDVINRPNAEKIIDYKKALFQSISPIVNSLSANEKEEIKYMNEFEIGYVFLKSGESKIGFKYCAKVLKSPKTIYYTLEKIFNKIRSKTR